MSRVLRFKQAPSWLIGDEDGPMPFVDPTGPSARRMVQIAGAPDAPRARGWRKPPIEWSKILLEQLQRAGHHGWQREFRFHPTRQWRFDCAHTALMLAIEVEGLKGTGKNKLGGHRGIKGFKDDIEKYGEAFALGWTLLRATTEDVRKGRVLRRLEARLSRA